MPKTVNQALLDRFIRHAVNLERFKNAAFRDTAGRALAALNKSTRQIVAGLEGTVEQKLRAEAAIRAAVQTARQEVERRLNASLADFAEAEGQFNSTALSRTIPIEADITTRTAAPGQVWAAASSRPFQGALLAEHMEKWGTAAADRLWGQVRQGILDGVPTADLTKQIMAGGIAGNPLALNARQMEAIVRTSIGHVASVARHEVAVLNDDIVKAEVWVSTLDSRTTPLCAENDGATRPLGEKQWSNGYYGEPGQAHIGCRSSASYITKSWRELGLDVDELPPGVRASMNGEVPEDVTYFQWLQGQDKSTLVDVLGKTRAEAFLAGDVKNLEKFYNDGRMLTLAELKSRDII